jgi:hypothetical protein
VLDAYLAKAAWDGAMLPEAADPNQPDNFWEPVRDDLGAHGAFDAIARGFSPQLWMTKHRALIAAMCGGAGVLGWMAARSWRRRSTFV